MEEFIIAGVNRDHLKIINYIRMHLKAITLADITTPNGRRITFDAWNVIGSNKTQGECAEIFEQQRYLDRGWITN